MSSFDRERVKTTSRTESNQVERMFLEHVEAMLPALLSALSAMQVVRGMQDTESFLRRALTGIVYEALATSYPDWKKKKRSLARSWKIPEFRPLEVHIVQELAEKALTDVLISKHLRHLARDVHRR